MDQACFEKGGETMTNELPAIGSVWGVRDDSSTWMQIREASDGRMVGRMFNGGERRITQRFPPAGYVRIDGDGSAAPQRTDTAGRDVTNLPGLWSEDDTIHVPPVGQTLKCNQCKKGGDE